jgi:hypothetical protein
MLPDDLLSPQDREKLSCIKEEDNPIIVKFKFREQ